MRIIVVILLVVVLAFMGGAAYFYTTMYRPMTADYTRMKLGIPELDKARSELKKYKEQEARDQAWIQPTIDTLTTGLTEEMKAGKAEVFSTSNSVVINISEQALYMPASKTFTKESQKLLLKLVSLLKSEKVTGKDILVGNTTQIVSKQPKSGNLPAKDARTLASERSMELVKYFENKGMSQDSLIAAAYSSQQPAIGSKIKEHKAIIVIANPLLVPTATMKQEPIPQAQTKPTVTTKSSATVTAATPTVSTAVTSTRSPAPKAQPKPIPITPAQPKQK